jgi:hypothetical protein
LADTRIHARCWIVTADRHRVEMVGGGSMKRIRAATVLVACLVTTLLLASAAWAGPQWCEEDPEFVVNGSIVDVTTLFPAKYATSVKGSVHFDMQVPSNAVAAVLALPGTVPVTASISYTLPAYDGIGQIPVVVTVSMSATKKFDTYTQVTGLQGLLVSGVDGTSAAPTRIKFAMYGTSLLLW